MHTKTTLYLSRLVIPYRPSRVLRSNSFSNVPQVPRSTLTFGFRCFHAGAPTIWNSLSDSIRSSDTFNCFGATLKHTFSKQLFIPSIGQLQRLRFICVTNGVLYKFLLTSYLLVGQLHAAGARL